MLSVSSYKVRHVSSSTGHLRLLHHRKQWSSIRGMQATNATPTAAGSEDDHILQRIQQQFDARADTYDLGNTYHPPLAERLLQLCKLCPGDRLLDLGSGTGIVGLMAASSVVGPHGRVVLVDITAAMLEQARNKHAVMLHQAAAAAGNPGADQHLQQQQFEQQAVSKDVHFIEGDMEDLSSCLPSAWLGSFDAITCSAAVPFLRNPAAALASWRPWLKQPGGRLALNVFVPPALEDFGTFRRLAQAAGLAAVVDPCERLGSVELVAASLQQAGYFNVQVSPEAKERWMPAKTVEAYALAIWQTALYRNPFMPPEQWQASASPEAFEELQWEFVAAVAADVEANGRLDATGQQVLNRYTVLHVLAQT